MNAIIGDAEPLPSGETVAIDPEHRPVGIGGRPGQERQALDGDRSHRQLAPSAVAERKRMTLCMEKLKRLKQRAQSCLGVSRAFPLGYCERPAEGANSDDDRNADPVEPRDICHTRDTGPLPRSFSKRSKSR
jgi:hypothetical protein